MMWRRSREGTGDIEKVAHGPPFLLEGLSERFWVAETASKPVCLNRRVGSNPTPSAKSG